jgi:hypothetical protein
MKAAKMLAGPQNAANAATDETLREAAERIARLQNAANAADGERRNPGEPIILVLYCPWHFVLLFFLK